ncbi:MAG: hypothetical protein CM15mP18_2530 [Methanobacteriota archaeon]|nr:MAG: hypothetical protein CM15mP18_2530 [Euryarchaeota archaeon]
MSLFEDLNKAIQERYERFETVEGASRQQKADPFRRAHGLDGRPARR